MHLKTGGYTSKIIPSHGCWLLPIELLELPYNMAAEFPKVSGPREKK